jgi:cyclin-dependent kinase 7
MKKLPDYVSYRSFARTPLRQLFSAASDDALDLLEKMIIFDPAKRISSQQAIILIET